MPSVTIQEYLNELASDNATPGGGYAASLTAAQGIALLEMALNLTKEDACKINNIFKSDYISELQILRAKLVDFCQLDSEAFLEFMNISRSSKSLPQEERNAALDAALSKSAEIPLSVSELSLAGLAKAEHLSKFVNINLLSDVAIAANMLEAAISSSCWNIQANTRHMQNKLIKEELNQKGGELCAQAKQLIVATEEEIERRWL